MGQKTQMDYGPWLPLMSLEGPEGGCPTLALSNPGALGKGGLAGRDITLLKPSSSPSIPPLVFCIGLQNKPSRKSTRVATAWESWSMRHKLVHSRPAGSCWECVRDFWCITCALVCCSAPAEGRTIRLWSAWCSSPGIFLGVRGSIRFVPQLLVSLSASLRTHWFDFGLFMAPLWINKTQTINGPKPSLAALFLLPVWVVCVSLSSCCFLENF